MKCGTKVKINGDDKVKIYESLSWASRGFCIDCGTHLFYKLKANGENNIPVGLFPNLKELYIDMQYFSDMRPSYYCFSNEIKEMATVETMAHFASKM